MKTLLKGKEIGFVGLSCDEDDYSPEKAEIKVSVDNFTQESQALRADLTVMAEETGYPLSVLVSATNFQIDFGKVVDKIAADYPNSISRIWTDPIPKIGAHIQFVGEVPVALQQELEAQKILHLIELTGQGQISMDEHAKRSEIVAETLVDLGYKNAVVYFDTLYNRIQIEAHVVDLSRHKGRPEIEYSILEHLQKFDMRGRAATIVPEDLNFVVREDARPIVELTTARGGQQLRASGTNRCTSGFVVTSSDFGDGIVTADHCTGINEIVTVAGGVYATQWRRGVFGTAGDVEFHTTAATEYDDFYSTGTVYRDVTDIRSTNNMVGNTICMYGRASNPATPSCNKVVEAINVSVILNGVTIRNQVRTSNNTAIPGDSGGPWFLGNTAWGVQSSRSTDFTKSYFTPAQQVQTALSVTIRTE